MKTIMIDPGHGGSDAGACYGTALEKNYTMILALEIEKLINASGNRCLLTHTTADHGIKLKDRTLLENLLKPDCIISVHLDSAGNNTNACGCTAHLHHKAPKTYVQWAYSIVNELDKICTSNRFDNVYFGYRGNSKQDYAINRDTKSPSMLLELGFITNASNRTQFIQHYKDYAKIIVDKTLDFLSM